MTSDNQEISYSYAYGSGYDWVGLQYVRFIDLLSNRLEYDSNKTALISEYENIIKTYADLNVDVNKLVNKLYGLGSNSLCLLKAWARLLITR
ncbi:unnamed protein product [Oppiella nova]|uniref:Uncharacterized protein n=1 Tax=Oppiella nova TaxID=334625 RepID=A0A7R9QEE9_9ACAR|nr:unnamed protein product [Oppiella nova]CAG2164237.1 unnamed protein product [Oppiella nova]